MEQPIKLTVKNSEPDLWKAKIPALFDIQ